MMARDLAAPAIVEPVTAHYASQIKSMRRQRLKNNFVHPHVVEANSLRM